MSPTSPTRSHIGKYRILAVLGEGAMGVVYRAHDPSIDREVALKTIRKQLLTSDAAGAMIERFRREAVAAGRLSHPGIVAVYDYGEDAETAFIVMELAPGESLDEYVQRRGSLGFGEIGALMTQLTDALGYAHERGVVHRDIKPNNLLVSPAGRLKITDFGIARIQSSSLTHPGVAVGTPAYMSPEQYTGGGLDHRADLFAAAVLFYELLTGALPFAAETIEQLAYRVVHTAHVPATQRRSGLSPRIDALFATALAKQPTARHASASELGREIAAALASLAETSSRSSEVGFAPTMIGGVGMPSSPRALPAFLTSEMMARLESALAGTLGPLAGVVVRRAAARASGMNDLVDAIAQSASSAPDRARIVETVQRVISSANVTATGAVAPPPTSVGAMPSAPGPRSSSPSVPGAILLEDAERTTTELAKIVGPIARVLVKKALPRATDLRSLCTLVAEGIERPADRAKFLDAMKVR